MHSCLHFAVDLLESLRRNSGATGNVLFSPFVLSSTLMALYNGARGRTADQIARAMHLGLDSCSVASSLPLWYAGLFPSWPDSHKRKFEISHDQCLVHDKSIRIAHGYKHWLSQWCRVEHEDFANDPTDGVVFPTRMTTWIGALTSFSCKAAEEPAFWSEVVRMMSHTGHFRTSENAALGVRVLELPYRESKKSMVILLPDESQSLRDLERKLTPQHIVQCLDALADNGPVSVRLPMFRLSDVVDLKQALPALGVRDAFRKDADFSTLCDSPNSPMVSFARHVAVFHARERSSGRMPSVANAQGTANGSGTLHPSADAEGEKQDEGKDEAKFTVDRPFVFLVMNSEPRAALLYGSVRKILGWK
ncbi:ipis-1-like isoform X5 [Haemaphysalis longicornis]